MTEGARLISRRRDRSCVCGSGFSTVISHLIQALR